MSYLTLQEIYDTAVGGVLNQGGRSRLDGLEKANSFLGNEDLTKNCAYRGPNGEKCPVGFLIKDEYYNPEIENETLDNKSSKIYEYLKKSGVDVDDHQTFWLLLNLQTVHDKDQILKWPLKFSQVARDHNLDPKIVDNYHEFYKVK